ncbi:MAG: hypothetical protein AAFV77_04895 [Planctomycetota bacterium]
MRPRTDQRGDGGFDHGPDAGGLADRVLDHAQVALRRFGGGAHTGDGQGIAVFRSRHGPGRFPVHEHPEAQISIRVRRAGGDRGRGAMARVPGSLHVVPPGVPHAATLATPSEFVLVYVWPDGDGGLRAEAEAIGHRGDIDIGRPEREARDASGRDVGDPWLEEVLVELRRELDARAAVDTGGGLVADALAHASQTRLLTHHPGRVRARARAGARLAAGVGPRATAGGARAARVARPDA